MDANYWDKIYQTKSEQEVSWFQENPVHSLELIREAQLPAGAHIIDIGGGESRLVDRLLVESTYKMTVLDISRISLDKLAQRLGPADQRVSYVVSDVLQFQSSERFDLWHDRATFHFLTQLPQVEQYLKVAALHLKPQGHLIISTFSRQGPEKCSGLPVHQYSQDELKQVFAQAFENTRCFETTHVTPWGSGQAFVYCGFKKRT